MNVCFFSKNSNFVLVKTAKLCINCLGNDLSNFQHGLHDSTSCLLTQCDKLLTNQNPWDIPSLKSGHLNGVQWILVLVTSAFPWDPVFDIQQSIISLFCSNYHRRIIILERASNNSLQHSGIRSDFIFITVHHKL